MAGAPARPMLAAAFAAGFFALAAGQGMPQWVPADAKDLFGELDTAVAVSKEAVFGEEACEIRTKLVKLLGPVTGPEKGQIMMMIFNDLGSCELREGKTAAAHRRFQSGISELNAPSEEALLQSPHTALPVLMRDGCGHLLKSDVSRAAVEFRRARTLHQREKVKMVKTITKQNKVPAGQEDRFVQTVLEKAKEGGQDAQQVKPIVRLLNQMDGALANVEALLKKLDDQVLSEEKALKDKRSRISRGSAGPYAQALHMEAVVTSPPLPDAEAFAEKAPSLAKEALEAKLTGSVPLLKRTKEASGCKKLPKACAAAKALPDLSTNGFGDTRVLALKAGSRQSLDLCDTNANLLIILPLAEGVQLDVDGGEAQPLEAQAPVAADHCLPLGLRAEGAASVLVAQAWHPEFATIERTTEVRDRAERWGLKEDEVKELTKAVNAHGKKGWDKALKAWQAGPVAARLRERVAASEEKAQEAKNKATASAEEDEKANDEERKKAIEELEAKRQAKREEAARKEQARLETKKRMEEERAKKDPWLLDPVVKREEAKLEELKQERRDANAKLEFDLTKQLTKDINEQERLLKRTIKKAKKAWKKGATLEQEAPESAPAAEAAPEDGLAAAEKRLAGLKDEKAKAVEAEDFGTAKKLKKDIETLEKEVAALRAKSEL